MCGGPYWASSKAGLDTGPCLDEELQSCRELPQERGSLGHVAARDGGAADLWDIRYDNIGIMLPLGLSRWEDKTAATRGFVYACLHKCVRFPFPVGVAPALARRYLELE